MDLITLTTKTRGRNSRDVEYQGIGKLVKAEDGTESVETEGVATQAEDLLGLPGIEGNLQRLLDFAVVGYNAFQRSQALDIDEFAGYIDASWDEKRVDTFKRAVRALAKAADMETSDAADIVKSKMSKAEVKPTE